jgi:hypothetical protein
VRGEGSWSKPKPATAVWAERYDRDLADIFAVQDAGARDTLLRLWPEFSLTWMTQNQPSAGDLAERLREALRKAGVPEA